MDLAATKELLRKVKEADKRNDCEDAHCRMDEMYIAVLESIARGKCDDPQTCAKEALKAQRLKFSRWYA